MTSLEPAAPSNHPKDRIPIHAYLTPASHEIWHNVATEEGVSLSGFIEALAQDFKNYPPEDHHDRWRDVIRGARKIDAERRRRGGA